MAGMKVRKAGLADVERIYHLLRPYVASGDVLPKTKIQLYGNIRDYFVAVDENDELLGAAGLHICWKDLAEVRSVAVVEGQKEQGVGRRLIAACLDEARAMGLEKAFVLTNKAEFFSRMGFTETVREDMPLKIWMDCVNCIKYPEECDEVPMIHSL